MGPKKVNSKVEAANAKKAAAQAQKDAKKSQEQEVDVAADWKKGANNRGAAKADAVAAKADEAARKKREKELLVAEEEEANSGIKTVKKQAGPKKGKKKKGSDLSFLEDSLTSAADKKAKEKKKKEKEKKEKEAQLALDRAAAAAGGDPDSLTGNGIVDVTDMIGKDDMLVENVNKPIEEEDSATGIEAGLSVFKFGKEEKDAHPEKR